MSPGWTIENMVARDGVGTADACLFRAVVTQSYLFILQDLASLPCPILSSLLEPKWSQAVQIWACRDLPQIETASS